MKNTIRTTGKVASTAAKLLKKSDSKPVKSVAGGALVNRKKTTNK